MLNVIILMFFHLSTDIVLVLTLTPDYVIQIVNYIKKALKRDFLKREARRKLGQNGALSCASHLKFDPSYGAVYRFPQSLVCVVVS